MAAFSSVLQQLPFLLDSNSDPSTTPTINCNNTCSLLDERNNANYLIPPLYQPHQNLDHNHNPTNNHSSSSSDLLTPTNNKNSMDSSSIVTHHDKPEQNLVTSAPMDNKRKSKHPSSSNSPNSAQSKEKRAVKGKKQKKMKGSIGEEKNKTSSKEEEEKKKEAVGYIHVRARRGQATDSHSLAERVRRERISERMKFLQGLVPGCDKVTGKALMLDEIINYVQSLQNQVEFLSMKLASVNPMFYDFGMDLESFMVRPPHDQDLSNLASALPSIQESSPTTANTYHHNHLPENSAHSTLLPQTQIPNVLPRQLGSRQGLWELDDHRQRIMNQSGFTNTFFSFH